jgi:asparagine synthase (glutamine-hydrolysing)
VLALPARAKLRGFAPRRSCATRSGLVPTQILERPKMGFPVPSRAGSAERIWPVVQELVLSPRARARGLFQPQALEQLAAEHRTGAADHGERLWLLANLEIWQRVFVEREDGRR